MPRSRSRSAMARASGTDLASRSSFVTTSVSPARTAARAWSRPGGAGETVTGVDTILDDAQRQERLALGVQILPDRHLLEYRPSRRSGQTAETRRPDGRARAPGPHPAHRRIPVAKAPIADLAYDSAPYRSRLLPGLALLKVP